MRTLLALIIAAGFIGRAEISMAKPMEMKPIQQINAGVLNMGYFDAGPATGTPVVLLHGWPYDIHSFEDVVPILTAKGYRVIVPYLRGSGSTKFLSEKTPRSGQQAATSSDIIALMDALKIKQAIIGGFDWGSRTAGAMAAVWPERCKGVVLVSGYLIVNLEAQQKPLPPKAEQGWWYQYYFSTERGRVGYTQNTDAFNKLIWKNASPKWNFDDATFNRSASSFKNPDHVAIVIHNYRWRLGLAPSDPQYESVESKLQQRPLITVPAITIASDFDGEAADGKGYAKQFTAKYEHRILKDIGHDVPHEDPKAFAKAIIDVDGFSKNLIGKADSVVELK